MYLTYAEYRDMGGSLGVDDFNSYEFEAESRVNKYTLSRLANDTVFSEKVKRVIFQLISALDEQKNALTTQGAVTSRSNDGVSESYASMTPEVLYKTMDEKISSIVLDGLKGERNSKGQRLLYRGLYPNE